MRSYFKGIYSFQQILLWLKNFLRRNWSGCTKTILGCHNTIWCISINPFDVREMGIKRNNTVNIHECNNYFLAKQCLFNNGERLFLVSWRNKIKRMIYGKIPHWFFIFIVELWNMLIITLCLSLMISVSVLK